MGQHMIAGIGIDIVELPRMQQLLIKKPTIINRFLTENEQEKYLSLPEKRQIEYAAGRFACKEAFSKAFGTGIGSAVSLLAVEILNDETGRPVVTRSPYQGIVHVSISHTDRTAIAQIILETQDKEN